MSLVTAPIKSITHPHLQAEIHYDQHPEAPETSPFVITYADTSRYTLGTTQISFGEFEDIARGVRDGDLIGLPVWAYVHGGSTIKAAYENPFGCPWDSGRSGWVFATKSQVRSYYGVKRITKAVKERALKLARSIVDEYSGYLNGECYGFIIRDTNTGEAVDSCWGYYDSSTVEQDAQSALKQMEDITPMQLELPI